eukprot:2223666-Pleurochrysis_carterae.AAC.5
MAENTRIGDMERHAGASTTAGAGATASSSASRQRASSKRAESGVTSDRFDAVAVISVRTGAGTASPAETLRDCGK